MKKRSASRRKWRKIWRERERIGKKGRGARRRRRSVYANGRNVGRGGIRSRRNASMRNVAWIKVSALNRGPSRIFGSILLRTDRSKRYICPSSKVHPLSRLSLFEKNSSLRKEREKEKLKKNVIIGRIKLHKTFSNNRSIIRRFCFLYLTSKQQMIKECWLFNLNFVETKHSFDLNTLQKCLII